MAGKRVKSRRKGSAEAGPQAGAPGPTLAGPEQQPAEWRPAPDADWVEKVIGLPRRSASNGIVLAGSCPRCGHDVAIFVRTHLERGPILYYDEVARSPASEPQVIRCNCVEAHNGRPEDEPRGCGVFGALQASVEP
jgi:hypothetical protein